MRTETRPAWAPVCAAVLLTLVMATTVYRAWAQSITYDEAFTYREFLAGPVSEVFTSYTANNHILFSVLAKLTTSTFGVSELTLRLPTLAGAAVYLTAIFLLCRLVFGNGLLFFLTVAALALNPFTLDFLSAARGYGLALALFCFGLYELSRLLLCDTETTPRRWLIASLALALSVSANIAFLFPAVSVGLVAVTLGIFHPTSGNGRLATFVRTIALWFCIPAAFTCAGFLIIPLGHAKQEHFFFGATSLADMVRGLFDVSLRHHPTAWTEGPIFPAMRTVAEGLVVPITVACMLGITCWLGVKVLRSRDLTRLGQNDRFLLLVGGTGGLTLSLVALCHRFFDLRYPHERTALYFIPLFLLSIAALAQKLKELPTIPRAAPIPLMTVLVLLVAQSMEQFSVTQYASWRFDAESRTIAGMIAAWPTRQDGRPFRVVASWWFQPSLDFYRLVRHKNQIAQVTDDWEEAGWAENDFFVLRLKPEEEGTGSNAAAVLEIADPVYLAPISGTSLLANQALLTAAGLDPVEDTPHASH